MQNFIKLFKENPTGFSFIRVLSFMMFTVATIYLFTFELTWEVLVLYGLAFIPKVFQKRNEKVIR